jgi:hypothetical protein
MKGEKSKGFAFSGALSKVASATGSGKISSNAASSTNNPPGPGIFGRIEGASLGVGGLGSGGVAVLGINRLNCLIKLFCFLTLLVAGLDFCFLFSLNSAAVTIKL